MSFTICVTFGSVLWRVRESLLFFQQARTVEQGALSTVEVCQKLALPNQTEISVDNRKILWWKMDTLN